MATIQVEEGQLTRLAYAEENLGGRDWDFVLDHHLNQNQNRLASASLEAWDPRPSAVRRQTYSTLAWDPRPSAVRREPHFAPRPPGRDSPLPRAGFPASQGGARTWGARLW